METNAVICTILSSGAIIANIYAAYKAIRFALSTDNHGVLKCTVIKASWPRALLVGSAGICLELALLKAWSITEIFANHWHIVPRIYHIQAYAYLLENYGVAAITLAYTQLFYIMSKCAASCDGDCQKCSFSFDRVKK